MQQQASSTIDKRLRILKKHKETDECQLYLEHKTLDESLPDVPCCDVPKREWERTMFEWRTCLRYLKAEAELGNLYI